MLANLHVDVTDSKEPGGNCLKAGALLQFFPILVLDLFNQTVRKEGRLPQN